MEAQSWGTESGEIDEMYSPQSLELNLDTEASERGSFGAEKTKKQNSAPVPVVTWARATQLDPRLSAALSESAESDNDPKVRSAGEKLCHKQTTGGSGIPQRLGCSRSRVPLVDFKSFRNAGGWAEEDSEQRLQPWCSGFRDDGWLSVPDIPAAGGLCDHDGVNPPSSRLGS